MHNVKAFNYERNENHNGKYLVVNFFIFNFNYS